MSRIETGEIIDDERGEREFVGADTFHDGLREFVGAVVVVVRRIPAISGAAEGQRRFPGAALWLGGFSFGAFVALRAAQLLKPAKLVAVAPPVARFELGSVANPDCDWMLAQGDADDVVPPDAVLAWAAAQPRKPRLHVLTGAGHFFHGKLHELKPLILDFLRS